MNLSSLTDIFSTDGVRQDSGGNQPFWVDDPEIVWFVGSGNLDVFTVPVLAEGFGARAHFFRAGPGNLVFGMPCNRGRADIRFQAVAAGESQLYRLPLARLRYLAAGTASLQAMSEALDRWIATIYQSLTGGALPPECFQLDPNEEVELKEGDVGQPLQGVIWVKHLEGRSRLAGLQEFEMCAKGGAVPLSPTVWLQVAESARLAVDDTPAQLRDNTIWDALREFHLRVTRWAAMNLHKGAALEGSRLQARSKSQRLALTGAVARLSEPLRTASQQRAGLHVAGDPLLAACQLISRALGRDLDPQTLAHKPTGLLDPLSRLAKAARLRVRRVILSGNWWRQDNGPILAYRQTASQPVALLPESATSYVLADPASQTREMLTADLAQSLNPVAYSFYRPFAESVPKVLEILRFGLSKTKTDQRAILLMSLMAGLIGVAMPVAIGVVFDSVIPAASRSQLWFIAVGLLAASLAAVIFEFARDIALLRLETRSDATIQGAVWDRLLCLPLPFFRNYTAGDLAIRANGINTIQQILSGAVITSILSGIFSIFSFALLFYYSSRLATVATVLMLLSVSATLLASWATLRLQRPLCALEGKISGQVLQFITGISKLRVAAAEAQAYAVWAREFSQQKKLDLKAETIENRVRVFNAIYPVLTFMCLFSVVAFWAEPGFTTGRFLAFSAAFMTVLHAGLSASEALISLLQIIPIYERARPILRTLPEVREGKTDPGVLSGRLELNQVTFRYHPDGPLILAGLSFHVAPGEFVAVVGPSGAGKSTLMRLLLGFEQPESGTIRYDGLDLSGLDVQAVRRQVGVVLQNSKLLPADIFENIVGSGLHTLEEAWEAARKAGLEEDLQQMPMGMHTVLGEGAATLSGGQRQRLMIARAIVSRPRILFFDEATSALDNRTQSIVSESLEQLQATRIIIAHRLSTIMKADRILVLDQGRLVETGTYTSLVNQGGLFAQLARRQLV